MVVFNRVFRTIVGLQSKLYDLTQKRLVFGSQNGSKVSMENLVRVHMVFCQKCSVCKHNSRRPTTVSYIYLKEI